MKHFLSILACMLFLACGNNQPAQKSPVAEAESHMTQTDKSNLYKNVQFAMDKDPVCMMPLSAGISDTAVIDGKVYGFCSPQCREAYVSDHRK